MCGQHPFILQAAFHLWAVEMKHSFLLRTKAKAFTLMQVPGLGVLQPLIASLGFDPRLRRRSALHSSGRCGGEVLSSPRSRLTPVSAPWAGGVTDSSPIPCWVQLSLQACPRGREMGRIAGRTLLGRLFPSFFEDSLSGVYFLLTFSVKRVQPVCKLCCSLAWEQGEYLPCRDFCGKFCCCCTWTRTWGISSLLFVNKLFLCWVVFLFLMENFSLSST